jgi:AbrB family looped-hinge helix DNA binding protein
MTYKVGAKGQVVLPKELRDDLGIKPGDEVVFDKRDEEIVVRRAKTKRELLDELVGSLPPSDVDPLEVLLEERRLDREREERKFRDFA